MPPIEARVKDLLDETRLAMLGTQLLLGLQYRAAFSPGFKRLSEPMQMFDCVALLSILVTAGLLLATLAFHQIAEAGHAIVRFVNRASATLQAALVPLALALGIDVAIDLESTAGGWVAELAAGRTGVVRISGERGADRQLWQTERDIDGNPPDEHGPRCHCNHFADCTGHVSSLRH